MFSHDSNSPDPYKRPVFSFSNKLYRFVWSLVWKLFCSWTPNPMHKWRIFFLKMFGAKIGQSNYVYPTAKIWSPRLLVTKNVVAIGPGVEIYNPGGVYLGDHCVLSQNAFICGATHDFNTQEFTYISKPIRLEDYVWICAHAIVLPGVHAHTGAVLGAGSIKAGNMEAWKVYAGNPAKIVKDRVDFLKDEKND